MNIYNSKQWYCDIVRVIKTLPELKKCMGQSIMITGATGLIGSAIVDLLIHYNETHNIPISIFAAGRSQEKIQKRFRNYCKKSYFQYVNYNASRLDNPFPNTVNYIIHGAGYSFPAVIMKEPVETMFNTFIGMYDVLKYATKCNAKRVLYVSSSEIYGIKETNQSRKENEYGYIDPLNHRNSYPISKIAAETLCASYAAEYDLNLVIVRPGHIYGPTASLKDNRVSSSFAYNAAEGNNIVLKSDGLQIRSYCYCLDCASAIIKTLIKGETNQAYNISMPDSIISIKQMAEILAHAGKVKLIYKEAQSNEKEAFNPMSNSSLNSKKLIDLGWNGLFDAETGLSHTIKILKEANTNVGEIEKGCL